MVFQTETPTHTDRVSHYNEPVSVICVLKVPTDRHFTHTHTNTTQIRYMPMHSRFEFRAWFNLPFNLHITSTQRFTNKQRLQAKKKPLA